MKPLRAIDLCCGAGGWAAAARGLPIHIVQAYDVWDRACCTYDLNAPATQVLQRDLRTASIEWDGGPLDLILGGIPCQWLSVARGGNRPPAEEIARERTLLDGLLRLVRELNPRWWCLEDVVQLRRELPPLIPYQILDAQRLGYSCQGRRRLFVGRFPRPPHGPGGQRLMDVLEDGPHQVRHFTLTAELAHMSCRRTVSPSKLRVAAFPEDARIPTVLTSGARHGNAATVVRDGRVRGGRREMTWREAALLQGFPRDWIFVGSNEDLWRMVANAVQVNLAHAILRTICDEAATE